MCGFCQRERIIFSFRSGEEDRKSAEGERKRADRVVQGVSGLLRTLRRVWSGVKTKREPFFFFSEMRPSSIRRALGLRPGLSIPLLVLRGKYLRLPRNRHFYFVLDVGQTRLYRVHKDPFSEIHSWCAYPRKTSRLFFGTSITRAHEFDVSDKLIVTQHDS